MSASPPFDVKAVLFDAYGTLFDVYSIGQGADTLFPGQGQALAALWRDKQIDYTRLRTLCDRYADFWQCTGDALTYACRRLGLALSPPQHAWLMQQYTQLRTFDDVAPTLQALRGLGLPLAILSNANADMLSANVQSAGIGPLFDRLLSVDAVRKFKTAAEAYQLGPAAFGCAAADLLFVSSNGWDIAGATWFGYTTFWVNRAALPPEELGVQAHAEGRSLAELLPQLAPPLP